MGLYTYIYVMDVLHAEYKVNKQIEIWHVFHGDQ